MVAATVPMFGTDRELLYTNNVPQVIAGVAVITFAVAHPPRISLPAALAVTTAYAAGMCLRRRLDKVSCCR